MLDRYWPFTDDKTTYRSYPIWVARNRQPGHTA